MEMSCLQKLIKGNDSYLRSSIVWRNSHFDDAVGLRIDEYLSSIGLGDCYCDFVNEDLNLVIHIVSESEKSYSDLNLIMEPYLSDTYTLYKDKECKIALGTINQSDIIAYSLGFDYGNFKSVVYPAINEVLKNKTKFEESTEESA